MRYIFSLSFLLLIFSANAQQVYETPPGTIKINDTLFIDKAPVDNMMYLEFMVKVKSLWNYALQDTLKSLSLEEIDESIISNSVSNQQNEEILKMITSVENIKISDSVNTEYYFNHPKFQYHPMVGVSKEQAQLYCDWRTDMVNLRWGKEIKENKNNYRKIKYRLPTDQDLHLATKVFSENEKIVFSDQASLEKINLKIPKEKEVFFLFDIPEFTQTEGDTALIEENKKYKFKFFRCVCEVEK